MSLRADLVRGDVVPTGAAEGVPGEDIGKGEGRGVGAALGFQCWWRSVCASREIKKPDQVLGQDIYTSVNWATTEICAQSGQCSTIMFWESSCLVLPLWLTIHTQHKRVHNFVTHIYNTKASLTPLSDQFSPKSGCPGPGMAAAPSC